jgi:hypothetical protein
MARKKIIEVLKKKKGEGSAEAKKLKEKLDKLKKEEDQLKDSQNKPPPPKPTKPEEVKVGDKSLNQTKNSTAPVEPKKAASKEQLVQTKGRKETSLIDSALKEEAQNDKKKASLEGLKTALSTVTSSPDTKPHSQSVDELQ